MAQRQNMSALQLEDLPDEMLEKVLSYLKIGDLIQSGHVSKRLRNIWNNESLWQSVELVGILTRLPTGRLTTSFKVQTDFITFLLDKGCQYLDLKAVKLTGTYLIKEFHVFYLAHVIRLPNILFTCLINSRARNSAIYKLISHNLF